jgi:hypothetical protein
VTLTTEAPGVTVSATYDSASGALTGFAIQQGVSDIRLSLQSID